MRNPNLTSEQRAAAMEEIAAMVRDGKTIAEINAAMGRACNRMITQARKAMGIDSPRPVKAAIADKQVLTLHTQGKRVSEIAKAIGRSDSYVAKSLARQGVQPSQTARPVTIVGIGIVPQPKTALRKLRQAYPDVQWTIARVLAND